MIETGLQAAFDNRLEFRFVMGDAAARTAQCEARPHNQRPFADGSRDDHRFFQTMGRIGIRATDANAVHRRLEQPAVFRTGDCICIRANKFHMIAFQHAAPPCLHGEIQRRLAAQCGQQRIRAFAADDFMEIFGRHRLKIRAVREFRIRHDRGRIAVEQNDFVTFAFQRLASLHA